MVKFIVVSLSVSMFIPVLSCGRYLPPAGSCPLSLPLQTVKVLLNYGEIPCFIHFRLISSSIRGHLSYSLSTGLLSTAVITHLSFGASSSYSILAPAGNWKTNLSFSGFGLASANFLTSSAGGVRWLKRASIPRSGVEWTATSKLSLVE